MQGTEWHLVHTRRTMEVKRTSWQTMDVTGGFIYYLYLPNDSS